MTTRAPAVLKITRARFFETPRSYETPSKPFYKSTQSQIHAPEKAEKKAPSLEMSSKPIWILVLTSNLDSSLDVQTGF